MKTSYANRGLQFEELINLANQRYQTSGKACIHKVPTEFIPLRNAYGRVTGVKVEHKSCVDYLGRYENIPVAIEAKHTSSDRIDFKRVEPHQASFLDDWCSNTGAIGLILVSFSYVKFYAIPWPFWKAARDDWETNGKRTRSRKIKAYKWTWTTPGMASTSSLQLLPQWEITGQYGFSYLKILDDLKND
jgi:recombination protein U